MKKQEKSGTVSSDLSPLALNAPTLNGIVTNMFTSKTMGVNLDLQSLVLELNEKVEKMQEGDKSEAEAILCSQVIMSTANEN